MSKVLFLLMFLMMVSCTKHTIEHAGGSDHTINVEIDFGLIKEIRQLCEARLGPTAPASEIADCVLDSLQLININLDPIYDYVDEVCDVGGKVLDSCEVLMFDGKLL